MFFATPCLNVSEREILCLYVSFLRMVAKYSLPHMLKSLHRLAIAIIMDSTNKEWMTKKLMLN